MKYLVTDPQFYKRSIGVILPITAQSFITMGVNMLDTIMVGQLGETALSATALGNQFILLFHICCMGIGMGATVLTARFWGQQDFVSLKKAITIALRFAVIFAAVFTAINIITPTGVLSMYANDADVISSGATYLRWSTPTFFFTGIALVSTQILRSIGGAVIPLIASVIALLINLLGNYMFIFGNFGAPEMGVAGAALGTCIARGVEFSIIMGVFLFKEKKIGYRLKDLTMKCKDLVREYIRISIPVLISDALLGLGTTAVAMVMGRIGPVFVAANSITSVTAQLSTVVIQGLSFAGNVVTGRTLGEGKVEQAQKQGYTFFFIGLSFGLIASLIITLISQPIIGTYNVAEETKAVATQLMSAISLTVIFLATNNILTKGVLRGGGDTKFLMVADILFLWVASIPLGILAGLVWNLPPFWIYIFLQFDQFIKAVWCIFRLKSGKWIKKIKGASA